MKFLLTSTSVLLRNTDLHICSLIFFTFPGCLLCVNSRQTEASKNSRVLFVSRNEHALKLWCLPVTLDLAHWCTCNPLLQLSQQFWKRLTPMLHKIFGAVHFFAIEFSLMQACFITSWLEIYEWNTWQSSISLSRILYELERLNKSIYSSLWRTGPPPRSNKSGFFIPPCPWACSSSTRLICPLAQCHLLLLGVLTCFTKRNPKLSPSWSHSCLMLASVRVIWLQCLYSHSTVFKSPLTALYCTLF